MKKTVILLLCAAMLAASFAGCGEEKPAESSQPDTTQAPSTAPVTTVPVTAPATSDSAETRAQYDFVAIKQEADKINSVFNSAVRESKFEGVVYMKLGNDFEYISTTGSADGINHIDNSINTCYYAGNITAQFTAAAVLMLSEEGKLELDDSIEKYFPDLQRRDKITIRNLLENSSGIKDYVDHIGTSNKIYFLQSELDEEISTDNSEKENNSAVFDWIMSAKSEFEPGSAYGYSSSNYFLLGKIIESVTGSGYEDALDELIFEPLGMRSTGFNGSDRLAVPYGGRDSGEKLIADGVGYSAFGMISNISDMLKWTDAVASDALLSEESKKLLYTPLKLEGGEEAGLGVELSNGIASVFSECGAYRSVLCYTTDKSEVFVSFTNSYNSNPESLYEEFRGYLKKYEKNILLG